MMERMTGTLAKWGMGAGRSQAQSLQCPIAPRPALSPAGDPGMCLLPSECPWLCGEGDTVQGSFCSALH